MKQAMWALIVKGKSGLGKERMFKFNKFHNDYRVRGRCECWAQQIRHGHAELYGFSGRMCLFRRFDISLCQLPSCSHTSLPSIILLVAQRRLKKEQSPDGDSGLPCIGHFGSGVQIIMLPTNAGTGRSFRIQDPQ